MKPKFFFDYIYYRVSEVYLRWEGRGGLTTGIVLVTWIQSFSLSSAFAVIGRLFYERTETATHAKTIASFAGFVVLALYIWNHFLYTEGKYEKLKEYWKDEPLEKRKLKGFFVVLSIILPMVPLVLVGVYW